MRRRFAARPVVFKATIAFVWRFAYEQPLPTQPRAITSRLSAASFLARASAGTGLAKEEAAAGTIRRVSDQRSRRVSARLLTENEEGSEDAGELHCGCGGGFVWRRLK